MLIANTTLLKLVVSCGPIYDENGNDSKRKFYAELCQKCADVESFCGGDCSWNATQFGTEGSCERKKYFRVETFY